MTPLGQRLRGLRLRTYLIALIAPALAMSGVSAGAAVVAQAHRAETSERIAKDVSTVVGLQRIANDIQIELLPSAAYVALTSRASGGLAGLGYTPESVGVTPQSVAILRDRTDTDVRRFARRHPGEAITTTIRSDLVRARRQIDIPASLRLGFRVMERLNALISARSQALSARAAVAGTTVEMGTLLRDVALLDAANQAASVELAFLTAYKFPGVSGSDSSPVNRRAWMQSRATYLAAAKDVTTRASADTRAAWRRAFADPDSRSYERSLSGYFFDPSRALAAPQLAQLYTRNTERSVALDTLESRVAQRAVDLARSQQHHSQRTAWLIGLLSALAGALSAGLAIWLRRSIARPLQELARGAAMVSHGELVDAEVGGPREIRTVSRGLSAAVSNLRRIEAQAAAVASGDLTSELVRTPLDGPLGHAMHASVVAIIDAIHERDRAQRDLAFQATHDSLTGLPNRAQAMIGIDHALLRARRNGTVTCLFFVDLDFFKQVNDTYGHAAGDAVLLASAERMQAVVRETDTVFRLGGDEFVILLEDTDVDFPFVDLAQRIIDMLSAPVVLGEDTARISASIGISLCQDAGVEAERLLSEADAAAYSAKHAGRGQVGVYDEQLRETLTHREAVERALQHAIEHDELVLHYQPVVDIRSARPTGFEALIRWQHPVEGLKPPADFIPVAEKSGLINRIGRWTLNEATMQLAQWDREDHGSTGQTMAVNISGRHLASVDLVTDVASALVASGIAPSRLVVEVTETVLVDDAVALDNLQRLRELGVVIAIDDFGTGYTSIGQLPRLPIDVVKIDRSFIASDAPAHRELVRLIVGAAHAFGLRVVAEGIEQPEQADALALLDVDSGQGFFYSTPQPAASASSLGAQPFLPATATVSANTSE